MRRFYSRLVAFCIACCISFCSVITPVYALGGTFAGLPSINAIIQGTVGTFVDSSTGVTITRSAVAIADGVSIPFTVAESATFADVAGGGVAAALASPAGLAVGVVIAAALFYGWHKCTTAPSGWCKFIPGNVLNSYGWEFYQNGAGGPFSSSAQSALDAGCHKTFDGYGLQNIHGVLGGSFTSAELQQFGGGGTPTYDAANHGRCFADSSPSLPNRDQGPQDIYHYVQYAPTTVDVPQATDPVHDPEAKSLTQRAMEENKLLPSVIADAAQKDGHPIDDPAVNPRIATTVSSPSTATPPTTQTETAPDGTVKTTTCTGTASLGISTGDNSTASLTKGGSSNCTIVEVAPDGTTKTSTKTTSDAPKAATGPVECGSPGRPKCAIDETGTPTDATTVGTSISSQITTTKDAATTAIGNESTADHKPATRWQFSFSLPSQCTPFPMFLDIVLDYCRFQPMIHDIMSMVWYGTTFFTIAGMFGRAAREG